MDDAPCANTITSLFPNGFVGGSVSFGLVVVSE